MRPGLALALVTAAACGRYGFTSTGASDGPAGDGIAHDGAGDGRPGDGRAIDGGTPCPTPPSAMFTNVAKNTVWSSNAFDGTPTQTADRLDGFLKSARPGTSGSTGVWTTTRGSTGAAWGTPTDVPLVDGTTYDAGPEISADGLTLWFTSDRAGGPGNGDIWVAQRGSRTAVWPAPSLVSELSSSANDEGIMVLSSGLVAYFHSDRNASLKHVYRTERASLSSPWSTPVLIELALLANAQDPWVTDDECTIYFSSDLGGAANGHDIWMATKPYVGAAAFGAPVLVTELQSAALDGDPWLTQDQRYIMFTSNRQGNNYDIYEATR